jgi:hypothetical protein
MDDFLKWVFSNAPSLAGLLILVWILYRQNERLTGALLDEMEDLKAQISVLAERIARLEKDS